MKLKNAQLSFIVLFILVLGSFSFYTYAEEKSVTDKNIFLDSDQDGLSDAEEKTYGTSPNRADTDGDSYSDGQEIRSGYNPLKPAPGDKLIPDNNAPVQTADNSDDPNKKNLTKEVAQKVSAALKNSDSSNGEVTVDQVKSIVSDSLQQEIASDSLPAIDPKDIKIKKQDYGRFSTEKQFEKKKADFSDYIAGMSYVLLSNSPEPINSNDDLTSLNSSVTSKITTALTTQNASVISDLDSTGEKTLAQIKDVEVPEEFVSDHIKALQFAQYATQLEKNINPAKDDPLTDLANYSKMQSLILSMHDFYKDVTDKMTQYDLKLDSNLQDKLSNYGVAVPANFLEEVK